MTRKVPFENGEYYHVFNRGVDKRIIFDDEEDYSYFMHILEVFNDIEPAENIRYFYRSRTSIENPKTANKERKPLVEIVSFCLMPNHFHIIIKQLVDGGISKFLQKLGTGFTHYFNKKNKRSGVLFQGKTKSSHIDEERYLNYLKMYIELNPLDIYDSGWKEKGIVDRKNTKEFLENYKWKSKPKDAHASDEPYVMSSDFLEYVESIEVRLR